MVRAWGWLKLHKPLLRLPLSRCCTNGKSLRVIETHTIDIYRHKQSRSCTNGKSLRVIETNPLFLLFKFFRPVALMVRAWGWLKHPIENSQRPLLIRCTNGKSLRVIETFEIFCLQKVNDKVALMVRAWGWLKPFPLILVKFLIFCCTNGKSLRVIETQRKHHQTCGEERLH